MFRRAISTDRLCRTRRAILLGACAWPSGIAAGADRVWITDGSGVWSDPVNWLGGVPNTAADDAVFGSGTGFGHNATVDAPFTVGRLVFESTASYDVVGTNVLNLGEILVRNTGSREQTVTAPLAFTSVARIDVQPATGWLHLGNPIGEGASGLSAPGGLVKAGAGRADLHFASAHTGGTRVVEGALNVSALGSLVGTGDVTVEAGGLLRVVEPAGNNAAAHAVSPNSVVLTGGALLLGGDVDPAGLLSAASTGGLLVLDGVTNFTAGGSSQIHFGTLPGGTALRLGALGNSALANTVAVTADPVTRTFRFGAPATSAASLRIDSPLADAASGTTGVHHGVGGRTILNAPNSYSGQTVIDAGALEITGASNLGAQTGSDADGTVVNRGGTLTLRGYTLAGERLTVAGGTVSAISESGGGGTINSSINLVGGGTFLGSAASRRLTMNAPITGTGDLTLGGVTLNAPNTFSGRTTVVGASASEDVVVAHPQALGTAAARVTLLGGKLTATVPITAGELRFEGTGTLGGTATVTSTQSHLEMRGGVIDFGGTGTLAGVNSIEKTGFGEVRLLKGGPAWNPTITVTRGRLNVAPAGLGAGDKAVTVASPADASLDLRTGTYLNDIVLNNATGFRGGGGLTASGNSIVKGTVVLGEAGSALNGANFLDLAGPVTGGGLTVSGKVTLSGAPAYTGPTVVRSGTLSVTGQAKLVATQSVRVFADGTLGLTTDPGGDRVADGIPISLRGGRLTLNGTGAAMTETLGTVTLESGASVIAVGDQVYNQPLTLTLSSLARQTGGTLFIEPRSAPPPDLAPRVFVDEQPALVNGIMGGWVVGGNLALERDFVTHDPANGIRPLPTNRPSNIATALPTDNVRAAVTSTPPLAADVTINSLLLRSGGATSTTPIDLGGRTLNLISGGLIGHGVASGRLTAGGTSSAPVELFAWANVISAEVADNPAGGSVSLVVPIVDLTLSGNNTYSGATHVNGTLRIASAGALPTTTDLRLNEGRLSIEVPTTVRVRSLALTGGSVIERDGSLVAAIEAGSYTLEEGRVDSVQFVGAGPTTKVGPGSVTIAANNDQYSGAIEIVEGQLTGAGGSDTRRPLGIGPVVVRAGGRLLHGGGVIDNSITLSGGELAVGSSRAFLGPVSVTHDSSVTTVAQSPVGVNVQLPPVYTTTLAGPLSIAGGVTLRRPGQGVLVLDGPVSAGVGAAIAISGGTTVFNTTMHPFVPAAPRTPSLAVRADLDSVVTFNASQRLAGLELSGDARAVLSPGGGKSLVTHALSLTENARLDVTDGALAVDYTGASPLAEVRTKIIAGRAGGAWDGPGIVTSAAAGNTALGYAEAADVLDVSSGSATFAGQSVDASTVLVRYTLLGDATLDGGVDFNDLVALAQNYNSGAGAEKYWSQGDFDYDGAVGFTDLVALAQNYNTTLPARPIGGAPAGFDTDLARAFASVPEPSAIAFLAAAALATRRRRRR